MSSLSAARADNYYYPRAWRPEHGSLNQFHGSHPLGARAKDATHGVLVVRFEMPFNVWCAHCETHIGRGVRFNAKKRKCGMYFSTVLYEFALTCAHCKGAMVIQTDPENRGYKLVSGVTQQTQGPDGHDDSNSSALVALQDTEPLNDPRLSMQLAADPFFRLEHDKEDQRVAAKRARGLDALLELKDAHDKDNYSSNAALRAAFRSQKKQLQQRVDEAHKLGLSIPLVDVHDDDVLAAKAVVYKNIPGKRRASTAAASSRHSRPARTSDHKSSARATHSASSTGPGTRASNDSFQHFGDAMGSHLHRLKSAKKMVSRHKRPPEGSTRGSTVAERARKPLRR